MNLTEINKSIRACLTAEHVVTYDTFIDQYKELVDWVIFHNSVDVEVRYHNTRHLIGVAFLAYMLDNTASKELVAAALIHDFDHQGFPFGMDEENIQYSLARATALGYFSVLEILGIDGDAVRQLVKFTEFTFDNPMPDTENPLEQAIRDADQLYGIVLFNDYVYTGLESEVGGKIGTRGKDFLRRNANYVASNSYYALRAETLYRCYIGQCLVKHVDLALGTTVSTDVLTQRIIRTWGYNPNSSRDMAEVNEIKDHVLKVRQSGCFTTLKAIAENGPLLDDDVPSMIDRNLLFTMGLTNRGVIKGQPGYHICTNLGYRVMKVMDD